MDRIPVALHDKGESASAEDGINRKSPRISPDTKVLAFVLAVGLLPRLIFLLAGESTLVSVIPDDAFYYFKTAVNIVAGNGPTFDGIHSTNGFHPLWMLLLLPIAALTDNPEIYVKVALGLSILLSLLSASLLYLIVRRLTQDWYVPLMGVTVYFLNPRTIESSLNGLETSLTTLLFTVALYLVISDGAEERKGERYTCYLGIILGLMFLARIDTIFYLIIFSIIFVLRDKHYRRKRLLILSAVLAAVLSPWFVYNWGAFGSPVQDSGFAIPYKLHEQYMLQGHSILQMLQHSFERFVFFVKDEFSDCLGFPRLLFAAVVICSLAAFRMNWRDPEILRQSIIPLSMLTVLSLWCGGLSLILGHTFVRWYARKWYFDQLILLSALSFCLGIIIVDPLRTWHRFTLLFTVNFAENSLVKVAVLSLAVAIFMGVPLAFGVKRLLLGIYPHQRSMLEAAYWVKKNLRENESAGAFNSGIMGFFSGKHVVNLDGSINNSAFAAIRKKELLYYMYREGISYYLDFDPLMMRDYGPFLGDREGRMRMVPVGEIDAPDIRWNKCPIRIYRLDWRR